MKITIKSTDTFVRFNGTPARVWEGTTEKGVPCLVLTSQVCIPTTHDTSEADRDLVTGNQPVYLANAPFSDLSGVLASFYDKIESGDEPHTPVMLQEVHEVTMLLLRFITGGEEEAQACIDYLIARGLARYEGSDMRLRLSSAAEELLKGVK